MTTTAIEKPDSTLAAIEVEVMRVAPEAGIEVMAQADQHLAFIEQWAKEQRKELDRRSHGDRTQWWGGIVVLSRAARPAGSVVSAIGGVVIVKTFVWLATAALVAAVGWWWFAHARSETIDPSTAQTVASAS